MSVSRECCVCQGEVTASGRSLVQRSPNECNVSDGVRSSKLDHEETLAKKKKKIRKGNVRMDVNLRRVRVTIVAVEKQ